MAKLDHAAMLVAAGNSLNHVFGTLRDKDAFPAEIHIVTRIGGDIVRQVRIRTYEDGEVLRAEICESICLCDAPVLKVLTSPEKRLDLRYWHVNVRSYADDTIIGEHRIVSKEQRKGWRGGY